MSTPNDLSPEAIERHIAQNPQLLGSTIELLRALAKNGARGLTPAAWHAVHVNEHVRVKLTPAGLDVLKREHYELEAQVPRLGPWLPPRKDADGYSHFQLWSLMQSFGPFINLGMPHNFFEPNEIQFATPAPKHGVTE